jgi:hypothetical protein
LTIELEFPKNLESVKFSGKDIIFKVRDKKGDLVDIVKQADVNLVSYLEIPVTPGRKTIIVKSLGSSVLVQIPCKNLEQACITAGQPGQIECIGAPKCLIECRNSAWGVIQLCPTGCNVNPPNPPTCA